MRRRGLASWLDRASLFAEGATDDVAQAEAALERGEPLAALWATGRALAKAKDNALALALAAEAHRALGLWEPLADVLGRLIEVAPDHHEAVLELALAERRLGKKAQATARLARLAAGLGHSAEAAALALAEDDLAEGDAERALQWTRGRSGERARVLRAVALDVLGRTDLSAAEVDGLPEGDPTDGLRALALGLHARSPLLLVRAALLDAPFARRRLAERISQLSTGERDGLVQVLERTGLLDDPVLDAAAASARGDLARAREALSRAADAGDLDAARELVRVAVAAEDAALLGPSLARLPAAEPLAAERSLARALGETEPHARLLALAPAGERPWAVRLRDEAVRRILPDDDVLDGVALDRVVRDAARVVGDDDAWLAAERVSEHARRVPRLAVMGEFNAGKSTLVNALLGVEIAPMGILPTTAVLHHVVFAEEPFARVTLGSGRDRVVAPTELRATLREQVSQGDPAVRVTVGLPSSKLRAIEIVDTPGYNADDPSHRAAADKGLDEVDVVLFLLDAGQAWKASERASLERVRASGASVLVVVNKLDRIPEGEREKLRAHVDREAATLAPDALASAVWVSAKDALAGRLGDPAALLRSGLGGLEAVLAERVIDRAPRLLDRAQRRRWRRVVEALLATTAARVADERARLVAESEARARCHALAIELSSGGERGTFLAARAVGEPLAALTVDLRSVGAGPDVREVVAARLVARLAPPLASALGERAPDLAKGAVAAAVEASLLGAAHAVEDPRSFASMTRERLAAIVAPAVARALARESRGWSLGEARAHLALTTLRPLLARLA